MADRPYPSSDVDEPLGPYTFDVDAAWTMAYAASIDDMNPRYVDSLRCPELIAPPTYPVSFVLRALPDLDRRRGDDRARLHVGLELIQHRAIVPPERLRMAASVEGVRRARAGAFVRTRYDVVGAGGDPVTTMYWDWIYPEAEVDGPDRPPPPRPEPDLGDEVAVPGTTVGIRVPRNLGHLYATASSGPAVNQHTDTRTAHERGHPSTILNGTASLALGLARVLEGEHGRDPAGVRSISCRFGAVVPIPSRLELSVERVHGRHGRRSVCFSVRNESGEPAVRSAVVGFG